VKSNWARIKTPGEIQLGKNQNAGRKIELRGIYYETGLVSIEKNGIEKNGGTEPRAVGPDVGVKFGC